MLLVVYNQVIETADNVAEMWMGEEFLMKQYVVGEAQHVTKYMNFDIWAEKQIVYVPTFHFMAKEMKDKLKFILFFCLV